MYENYTASIHKYIQKNMLEGKVQNTEPAAACPKNANMAILSKLYSGVDY